MKLFDVVNYQPNITAEALLIPEFKAIFDRDKSKDKSKAVKEIGYVYFSTDYQSNYLSFTKAVRDEELGRDFIGDSKYQPDGIIRAAMDKYEALQQTPTMNFLKSARNAMQATQDYFNGIDYNQLDLKGQPVYKIKDITSSLGGCSKIIESIDKLMEAVRKEQTTGGSQRGGGTGGAFEFDDDQE